MMPPRATDAHQEARQIAALSTGAVALDCDLARRRRGHPVRVAGELAALA